MRALVCILELPERDPTRLLANVDGADPLALVTRVATLVSPSRSMWSSKPSRAAIARSGL